MIEVISNNAPIKKNLENMFQDYAATPEKQAIVLQLPQSKIDSFFAAGPDVPVILIDAAHEDAAAELKSPVRLQTLRDTVARVISKNLNTPTFETPYFEFRGSARRLVDKKTKEIIRLTEKETAMIAYIYLHRTRLVSKEQLLLYVWNYSKDTETHTVETHVYALRQKIGDGANNFIQTSPEGYQLVIE